MTTKKPPPGTQPSPLREAILSQRSLYVRAAWLTLITGILTLTPSWFMFEVYGRVINSRNTTTLVMLLLMVVGVNIVGELLDLSRARLMQAASEGVDQRLRNRLFDAAFQSTLRKERVPPTQAFNDLKALRDFIASPVVKTLMDLPSAIVFMILLFIIGPWLGLLALLGAAIQVALAVATDRRTMPLLTEAMKSSLEAQSYAGAALRNSQVIESMGMIGNIHKRWMSRQQRFLALQSRASDHGGLNATAAKLNQTMQGSLMLGGACLLVLHNSLMGGSGMMIVASIIGGKALAPMAQLVAQWRAIVNVRDAYQRLEQRMSGGPSKPSSMPLPAPKGVLTVEAVVAPAPGTPTPILRGVSFGVRPGEVLAVIGPSAAGKSTLARLLVGVWPATSGKVRLDAADVYAWNKTELGPHIGYLPQGVELFDGTVAENIARFGRVDLEQVRAAAQKVGILEMVEALPNGFDTRIGEDGEVLSGGQRQRLGLARAIYGDPQFLVLDEPNSSLDEAGEQALLSLLESLKARQATVVIITHRTTILPAATALLILRDGQVAMFGPRDEVFAALAKAANQAKVQNAPPGAGMAPRLITSTGAAT
jgi:ATP-binding cassette subfamily C exporter for protease/lipase